MFMKHELRKEGHMEMRKKSQGQVTWSCRGGLLGQGAPELGSEDLVEAKS